MNAAIPSRRLTYWIVVADESRAVFYSREGKRSPLHEFLSLDNEAARKKTEELLADRGGRSFDSHGEGRHTMSREKSDPKRHLAEAFAKDIAERLHKARQQGRFEAFTLIAAPRFLGLLRAALIPASGTTPDISISKEMIGRDSSDIAKLLDDW